MISNHDAAVGRSSFLGNNGSAADLHDPRLVAALDEYMEAVEAGQGPDRTEFLARHAAIAGPLALCLDGLMALRTPRASSAGAGSLPTATDLDAVLPLGDYRLVAELGRGGMGVVYEAEQLSLGRRVALKVLPFAATLDARQLQRFHNEARAAACLHHANIVPVHGVGCERGVHYYAMQLIEGQSLEALLHEMRPHGSHHAPRDDGTAPAENHHAERDGYLGNRETIREPRAQASTLPSPREGTAYFRRIAELMIQAAEALEHAHQSGVVHRDIKPGNLMLDGRGNLWVTDFGLAQFNSDARLTLTGDLVGTLRYMSPEQALAKRVIVDHRTDIYSLGATLYELLALRPAFSGQDRQELLRQIAFEEPVPLRRVDRSIPAELETILAKAMEKNLADRYATAKEMADDLKRYLKDEPTLARRPSLWQRGRKWGRRHVAAVRATGAALLMVLVVLGGGAGWWFNDRANQEEERLRQRISQELETKRQQADTARAVATSLGEADQLQKERKLPEAWAKAHEAAAILAGGASTPELEQLVQARLSDLGMAANLEQIRNLRSIDWKVTSLDHSKADQDYAKAFREFGIDVVALQPEEAALRIRHRTVAIELAAALDDWAAVARAFESTDAPKCKRLLAVARVVDPEPMRNKLRGSVENGDAEDLNNLLSLALDRLEDIPPPTLVALAKALQNAGNYDGAVQLLQQAQRRHRTDYWINFELAYSFAKLKTPNDGEAIRYYTATLALRSDSAPAHTNLGSALQNKGRLDDAIVAYKDALRLKPDIYNAHNLLGTAHMAKGQLNEGIAAYREAIRLKPDSGRLYNDLGIALAKTGLVDEAITALREAVRLQPGVTVPLTNLGSALHKKGLIDNAIAYLRMALSIDPNHASACTNLGSALLDKGKIDEAIAACKEAVRLDPNMVNAQFNLGVVLGKKGLKDEAIVAFREAIRLKPDYATAHDSLGVALAKKGLVEDSIAAFQEAIRLDPASGNAHSNLGFAFYSNGQLDEAIVAYQEAIRLKPIVAKYHDFLGRALQRNGQADKAIVVLQEAIRLDPTLAIANVYLGLAFRKTGQLDKAIGAFQEAIRLGTNDPETNYFLGTSLWLAERVDEAIPFYREAIRLKPDYLEAHTNLGIALARKGQWDNAIAEYQVALRLRPGFAIANNHLGIALRNKGLLDAAIAAHREAIREKADYVEAHYNLGLALRDKGLVDDGIAAVQEAIRLRPAFPEAHCTLGDLLQISGKLEKAIDAYRKAFEINPKFAPAYNNLAWLLVNAADPHDRRPEKALAYANTALMLDPKNGNYWNTRGVAHYRNGQWIDADQALSQALKLPSKNGWSFFFLAMTHWQLNNPDQARKWYDQGVKWMEQRAPKDADVLRFRAEAAELLRIEVFDPPSEDAPVPKK